MFDNILSTELKNTYNQAIDHLLSNNGLTLPCIFKYTGANNEIECSNCKIDPISRLSANTYNGSGPNPFPDGALCPVCMGAGLTTSSKSSEIIYLACIFDSKYWLNWASNAVNIPNVMVQTICKSDLLPKIKNANEIIIDSNMSQYGNYTYERASDPSLLGFGSSRYIMTMSSKK